MKNKTYNMPRGYLSYSAFTLWKKDPGAFRRRYYENEKPFETPETMFGKKIADHLQELKVVDGLEVYSDPEHRIEVAHRGLKLLGYIDSFDPEKLRFREFKTGHLNPQGKAPWDKVKVYKHEQLVFYSMLIEMKYGKVEKVCHLDWMETEFAKKSTEFDGHVLEAESRELRLTGKILTFRRIIFKWEREKLKKEIIKIAKQISDDYENYQKGSEQGNVKAREAIA